MSPRSADAGHGQRRPPVPQRGLTTLLALVLPVLVALGSALLVLSWRPELPDPVAIHWNTSGVDGTGSLSVLVGLVTTMSVLFSGGAWALAFFAGREAPTRRMAVGFALGLATFLAGTLIGTLAGQRGIASAEQAPDVVVPLMIALVAGLVAGAAAALAVRPDPPMPAARSEVRATAASSHGGRIEWVEAASSAGLRLTGALTALLLVVIGLLTGTAWVLVPLGTALGLLLVGSSRVIVRVDSRGMAARGTFGWPRLAVPADEVLDARVITVSPMRDFGGWGYRVGRGGTIGIVVRAGEAIEVQRTGGRTAVVTVDDAARGARVLRTVAVRAPRDDDPGRAPAR